MTGPAADEPTAEPAVVEAIAAAAGRVRDRIAEVGGDPAAVTLVAVTKGHNVDVARAALAAGLVDLGESYGQELAPKADALAASTGTPPPRWHVIGRLQRNKVRLVAAHVALWQSVDRPELAAEIARRAPGAAVLVQVAIGDDPAKGGCRPGELDDLVSRCRDLGLDVRGLMAIGPTGPPRAARPGFEALVAAADRLGLAVRSMGMSADLEEAVASGSTMVRVGTDLFGARRVPPATVPSAPDHLRRATMGADDPRHGAGRPTTDTGSDDEGTHPRWHPS